MQTGYDLNMVIGEKVIYDIGKSGHYELSRLAINFNADIWIYGDQVQAFVKVVQKF